AVAADAVQEHDQRARARVLDGDARRGADALQFHLLSSASSTRSGVIGSRRRRAPVALQIALAIAGAAPTSEGSPTPLAPTGCVGSGSSSTMALISTGTSSTPGIL